MSYNYETEKPWIFTDAGQRQFLKVRDFAFKTLKHAGAVSAGKLIDAAGGGDSFKMMACVDRLVELEDLRCVYSKGAWQQQVYVGRSS